ncbi:hypothetical protein EV361DRAFT_911106 [Lentinula raphanica]|nr:hypothetical protein EV361DRAFT_911106 [Lentinula raphanica]
MLHLQALSMVLLGPLWTSCGKKAPPAQISLLLFSSKFQLILALLYGDLHREKAFQKERQLFPFLSTNRPSTSMVIHAVVFNYLFILPGLLLYTNRKV